MSTLPRPNYEHSKFSVIVSSYKSVRVAPNIFGSQSVLMKSTEEQPMTGREFYRTLKKKRFPLSCFAAKANTSIVKLKALQMDKAVPVWVQQELDKVFS